MKANKSRLILLIFILLIIGLFFVFQMFSGNSTDSNLENFATSFLELSDKKEFKACREMATITENRFIVFQKNREDLGTLKSRNLTRKLPLRFEDKNGFIFYFNTNFEHADLREIVSVLSKGQEKEVFALRYEYRRLPRPNSREHYNGDRKDIAKKVTRCIEAFEKDEWRYFEVISVKDVGYSNRNAKNPLIEFKKKYGKASNRSFLQEVRLTKNVPGCLNLNLIRVLNRTSYVVDGKVYRCDEYVYLVRDFLDHIPDWHVYAFVPGKPKEI